MSKWAAVDTSISVQEEMSKTNDATEQGVIDKFDAPVSSISNSEIAKLWPTIKSVLTRLLVSEITDKYWRTDDSYKRSSSCNVSGVNEV